MKRVLFDSDVLLDILAQRQPFVVSSSQALNAVETLAGFIAPQTILLWGGEEIEYCLENRCIRRALIKKYRFCVEQGLANYNILIEAVS